MRQRTKKKNSTEKKDQGQGNNEALLCRKVKESFLFLIFLYLCFSCSNYPSLQDFTDEDYSSQQGSVPHPTSYIDNGDETITDENENI